jgi:large subunit ribosomal protein L27
LHAKKEPNATILEQYVIPGNIIFRQRGTHWYPGDNCAMGRDHTIYATESGYVKYYKDLEKHPKRQYIGVVFERDQVLPLPRNSIRRRRLGMVATKMELPPMEETTVLTDIVLEGEGSKRSTVRKTKNKERKGEEGRNLQLRPGYMYREANWEIGRAAERAKVKVRAFKPRDRWTAWRKSTIRKAKNADKKSLGRKMR